MSKDDVIELGRYGWRPRSNTMFHVDIGNGHTILAHISESSDEFYQDPPGDKVTVQMSP